MTAIHPVSRRAFLAMLSACGLTSGASTLSAFADEPRRSHDGNAPARIANAYVEYLPGEREALAAVPRIRELMADAVVAISGSRKATLHLGESLDGWQLVAITNVDGRSVGVMEKRATHRGSIAFVGVDGTVAVIPKWIGDLAQIRPRPIAAPEAVQLKRAARHVPGPDVPGNYILGSTEDPSYENVAALGPERSESANACGRSYRFRSSAKTVPDSAGCRRAICRNPSAACPASWAIPASTCAPISICGCWAVKAWCGWRSSPPSTRII